ncbi:unnamed protein product, partial [Aphanomyces euteiches]
AVASLARSTRTGATTARKRDRHLDKKMRRQLTKNTKWKTTIWATLTDLCKMRQHCPNHQDSRALRRPKDGALWTSTTCTSVKQMRLQPMAFDPSLCRLQRVLNLSRSIELPFGALSRTLTMLPKRSGSLLRKVLSICLHFGIKLHPG